MKKFFVFVTLITPLLHAGGIEDPGVAEESTQDMDMGHFFEDLADKGLLGQNKYGEPVIRKGLTRAEIVEVGITDPVLQSRLLNPKKIERKISLTRRSSRATDSRLIAKSDLNTTVIHLDVREVPLPESDSEDEDTGTTVIHKGPELARYPEDESLGVSRASAQEPAPKPNAQLLEAVRDENVLSQPKIMVGSVPVQEELNSDPTRPRSATSSEQSVSPQPNGGAIPPEASGYQAPAGSSTISAFQVLEEYLRSKKLWMSAAAVTVGGVLVQRVYAHLKRKKRQHRPAKPRPVPEGRKRPV